MLPEKEITRISKFLSLVLRHRPETAHIELDENGWTDVATLLDRMKQHRFDITPELLDHVVETNAKKRFAFNDDKTRIRASQGHSVEVDLGLAAAVPPDVLYHGTADRFLGSILAEGLKKMDRRHVHLSRDPETASKVGQRHGRLVILYVDAAQMHADGLVFYVSENGVWLTDHVPVRYLRREG